MTIDPLSRAETWTAREQVVKDPITVYSHDQTVSLRKHGRTKALEQYWDLLGRYSNKDYRIALREGGAWESWRGKLKESESRQHIFGERQFAVRAGRWTRFIGIDLDLHNGDVEVFRKQLHILLDNFWGKASWHLQVKEKDAAGIHLIRYFQRPVITNQVVQQLRAELCELNEIHVDLGQLAKEKGMKPLSKVEIKPTQSVGLRLPLAPGRTILIDRPLKTTIYRGNEEPDVTEYMKWVNKALDGNASVMQLKDVIEYVHQRLRPFNKEEVSIEPIIVPPLIERELEGIKVDRIRTESQPKPVSKSIEKSRFKGMKGRSWSLISGAWTGAMEPDSLNHWIRQLTLYAPFGFANQDDAIKAIERFIEELPNWSFSDRLTSGKRTQVSAVVRRDVNLAFQGWIDQSDPKTSATKLKASWNRWKSTGRDLFDKATWTTPYAPVRLQDVELGGDFEWSATERLELAKIAKLLSADLERTAAAIKQLIQLIRAHGEVPRTWIRSLLNDHNIPANSKKIDKPRKLVDKLIELRWIYVAAKHNKGRCRRFELGKLRSKFTDIPVQIESEDEEVFLRHDEKTDVVFLNNQFFKCQKEIFATL